MTAAQRGDLRRRELQFRLVRAGAIVGMVLPPITLTGMALGQAASEAALGAQTTTDTPDSPRDPQRGAQGTETPPPLALIFPERAPDDPQPWDPGKGPLIDNGQTRHTAASRAERRTAARTTAAQPDPASGPTPASSTPTPTGTPTAPSTPPTATTPPADGTFGDGCEEPGDPVRCKPATESPAPTTEPTETAAPTEPAPVDEVLENVTDVVDQP